MLRYCITYMMISYLLEVLTNKDMEWMDRAFMLEDNLDRYIQDVLLESLKMKST